jgi:hypothetical protein
METIVAATWPELPYAAGKDTCSTLKLWTQIVGKVRLSLTPWINHSWHVTLRVTARGLGTPLTSVNGLHFQVEFDFINHILWLRSSDGHRRQIMFKPMPVAEFYSEFLHLLSESGIEVRIDKVPNEVVDAIPFDRDLVHTAYDPDYVTRLWRVLLASQEVFSYFRSSFLGKSSPVHFFWESFDLAVTRFSGRRAPRHPAGYRTCPMLSCRRPIPMRSPAPDSGRAGAQSTTRRFIPTPTRHRRILLRRRSDRSGRFSAESLANSFCHTTRYAPRPTHRRP